MEQATPGLASKFTESCSFDWAQESIEMDNLVTQKWGNIPTEKMDPYVNQAMPYSP